MDSNALLTVLSILLALVMAGGIVRWNTRASLSDDEQRFRQDLMGRVQVAEGEIRDLKVQLRDVNTQLIDAERRELAWQQRGLSWELRELDWQRAYSALETLYRALVDKLGPGANAPPPPPPPPPPEGSDGGLLITGPSPRPRTMPSSVRNELLNLLDRTVLNGGVESRDSLLRDLPDGLRTRMQRSAVPRTDLDYMIDACLEWGGPRPALSAWLDNVIAALGPESEPAQRVAAWRAAKRW